VTLFHDAPYSVRRIELLQHCQKFLDDPTLLSSPYMVQSNASPGAFTHFIEILNGSGLQTADVIQKTVLTFPRLPRQKEGGTGGNGSH
jgi:hypothetical protein